MKLWGFFLGGLVAILSCSACSCTPEPIMEEVWGGSAKAPVFLDCRAVSAAELIFRFSEPVRVLSMRLDPPGDILGMSQGELVSVSLKTPYPGGLQVLADLVVENERGNTLNVLAPFRARNDAMPSLLITEVRTEYSKPKVEFIECKILEAGNLGALRLFIVAPGATSTGIDAPFFEFSPVTVKAGEYMVLHLRTLDSASVDETGDDLGATPYTKDNEAQSDARDFWIPDSKKHISKREGAIYLLDQDDRVLDALLWSESPDPWWKDEKVAQAAEFLGKKGAWLSSGAGTSEGSTRTPTPAEAVLSRDTTATRSISRSETAADTNRAADWYITAASCATPGKQNSDKRYIPKVLEKKSNK